MLAFLSLRYLSDNYEQAAKKELRRDYPDPNAIGNGGRSSLSVWIGQFAAGSGKKAGEFYTPQRISDSLWVETHQHR